jgi:FixJ family two-component response regulator
VVLTGSGSPELREECLRAGAEAFVEKPFDVAFVVDIARKAALAKRERERSRESRGPVEQQHSN